MPFAAKAPWQRVVVKVKTAIERLPVYREGVLPTTDRRSIANAAVDVKRTRLGERASPLTTSAR
jgi:hypothetical protein